MRQLCSLSIGRAVSIGTEHPDEAGAFSPPHSGGLWLLGSREIMRNSDRHRRPPCSGGDRPAGAAARADKKQALCTPPAPQWGV